MILLGLILINFLHNGINTLLISFYCSDLHVFDEKLIMDTI